jgi:hypothetical protein
MRFSLQTTLWNGRAGRSCDVGERGRAGLTAAHGAARELAAGEQLNLGGHALFYLEQVVS